MSDDLINVDNDLKKEEFTGPQNSLLELTTRNYPITAKYSREFDLALPTSTLNNKTMIVEEVAKYTYPTQLTNIFDRENYTVATDHCYARPWNWRPETSFLRPSKTLFFPKQNVRKYRPSNPLAPSKDLSDLVDVESEPEVPTPVYDVNKAKNLMEECEKYAISAKTDPNEDNWEEKVSKTNWTPAQHRIFSNMVAILNSFNLGKLANTGAYNEPILQRTVIDKGVQRVRRLLATVSWDPKITQWLHQLLIDSLGSHYLAYYLEILQTLKAKLPTFVDKMMYSPSASLRLGPLSNTSLFSLLEHPWDPVASSLMQDKPKKLPGNPILIIVPSAPVISKAVQKWVKLLSHLGNVITIPTNFGSSGHRMTTTNCIDQLFSLTRGKIRDVRNDYPGRPIILIGFRAGAALALQIAQVDPVLCVVAVGFSLLTAEGRRGEPDDDLLELQCPVLFVIGQHSNVTSQEDMEDLRERMRVETGLIVVGSADDYLRVTKKKKKTEGITQSIVDRCVVDEIGEFVSSAILSPFPPQIRQSPTLVSPETTLKKGKLERKRYNSNASSLDSSEPPSPTPPRISRPGLNNSSPTTSSSNLGRPPGSKSKPRLETKWAQQIAQGNNNPPPPTSSSSSPSPPPPYPTIPTPDTSSADSLIQQPPEKQQPQSLSAKTTEAGPSIKKIKTLKPVINIGSTEKQVTSPSKGTTARMQAYGLHRSIVQGGSNLSTLLQGGIKTIPPNPPKPASGIKVLENVTLNTSTTAKLIQNRTIDLSKITLINSVKGGNTTVGNVLLLPDGKIKTIHGSAVKTSVGNPILVPLSPQKGQLKTNRNKYITTKRQLVGQKPPRPLKKPIYIPTTTLQPTLPPPTNLTTQDIMDLPIIFADDNQLLDTSLPTDLTTTVSAVATSPQVTKVVSTLTPAKFMLINKQANHGNFIITPANIKKSNPMTFGKPPPKYTKIILSSKKTNVDDKCNPKIQCLSPEITVKKVLTTQSNLTIRQQDTTLPMVELIDLENEIKATAVPKPNLPADKNISLIQKNTNNTYETIQMKPDLSGASKRPSSVIGSIDDTDPDYIPPKNLKIE